MHSSKPITSRTALLVVPPHALIGGVFAVKRADGISSVASLVDFCTPFEMATRTDIMMVSYCGYLMRSEMVPIEIQAQMRVVILRELFLWNALNMIVLPVLYRFGRPRTASEPSDAIEG